jgi:Flp pilus assembly protein TadG
MRTRRRTRRRSVGSARRRFDWRDDRGVSSSVEQLFAFVFLLMLFLFFMQVIVWWHARNILEQSAAEGARAAAAADGGCADAGAAAASIATRIGGGWVRDLDVACTGGAVEGELVVVTVTASTPGFVLPGSLTVSAVANAPEESP